MPAALMVRLLFWLWFGAAAGAGHFLWLQRLPSWGVPGVALGLAALVLGAYFRIGALRARVDALDIRALVLLHVTRFVGIYFLVMYQHGELPRTFAVPAAFGGIVVATMALPVAFAPLEPEARWRAIRIWNVVGLLDVLLVLVTALRMNLGDSGPFRALTHLPLSLLPTFLLPLILATHVIIFSRIARAQRPA